ncbi:MAG: histidine phosphatase family protein [Acidimicrobiia bacterium]|jgi:8-oxo-dGTP diphosphatase|nr:histidine phosphatase family protein [Acidimicrobiia bacterium]
MAVFLVRHAIAKHRHGWSGDDLLRPLTSRGRRQADGIADLLDGEPIGRVVSSPATRCRQTVAPVAERLGLEVGDAPELFEGEAPKHALGLVLELTAERGDSVLCTHGDLVPDLLDRLRHHGLVLDADPAFAKGSTWHLAWDSDRFTIATYLPPPA